MLIIKASTATHFTDAAHLIRQYHAYIDAMQFHMCIAGDMEQEVSRLPEVYPAHQGGVFVAYLDEKPVGVVALERQAEGIAEIRRLYVSDAARGQGLGAKLIEAAVEEAKKLGYHTVRLDTFRAVNFAAKVYRTLGFQEIPPYNDLPPDRVVFMEKTL